MRLRLPALQMAENAERMSKMDEVDAVKIGETIKIRRIRQKISQTRLAEELGISQTHLSNAENGRVMLSLKTLLKLKKILKCTLDDLVEQERNTDISSKGKRYRLIRCID